MGTSSSFDYMKQFWRENEMQMFSAKETQLYFFFLAECNRQYWRNPFGCSTQRIANNLGISRQTICRLRKKLQDRGLVIYEEGRNNSVVPYYTLLMKTDNRVVQNVTENGTPDGTAHVTPCETTDGTIIETDNTENNKSLISKEEPLPLGKVQNLLCGDGEWVEQVNAYLVKQGFDPDKMNVRKKLEEFFLYLQTSGTKFKSLADTQKHFVNWLAKKERDSGGNRESKSSRQVGVKLADNSPDKFKNISGW